MSSATGKWNVIIQSPLGQQKREMVIDAQTDSFTALVTDVDETHPIAGTIVGDRLTWNDQVTSPMKLSLHFDVSLAGDEMTGVVKLGIFGKASFAATRTA